VYTDALLDAITCSTNTVSGLY